MSLKTSIQYTNNNPLLYHQKTYQEIIQYLDNHWQKSSHLIIQKLNHSLGNLSSKLSSIIIAGTNGKSTTIHYLEEILHVKNIKTGSFISPHFITYNERFRINGQIISNNQFTELANKVLPIIEELHLAASSKDILTAMALILFNEQNVNVAIFEHEDSVNQDPVTICIPIILGIPKISEKTSDKTHTTIHNLIDNISHQTHVISADQNKSSLKIMAQKTKHKNGIWVMPIRKVAPLAYPYEQLFGKYASLADRIVQTYLENHAINTTKHIDMNNTAPEVHNINATSTKTIHAADKKTKSFSLQDITIKNTYRSLSNFWQSINNHIPHKFQIITQKDTIVILDNAHNIADFSNLFLGIRLLNYQHDFQNISLIVGCIKDQCDEEDFITLIRSYFKKNLNTVSFCSTTSTIGEKTGPSWNIQHLMNLSQYAKIKALHHQNLQSAVHEILMNTKITGPLENNKKNLLVITGSPTILTEYWNIDKATSNKKVSL